MAESPAFLKLSCAVQNYAWGKVGEESEVARRMGGDPAFTVDPKLPYAEVGRAIVYLDSWSLYCLWYAIKEAGCPKVPLMYIRVLWDRVLPVVYEVAEVISRHIRPGSNAERVWR